MSTTLRNNACPTLWAILAAVGLLAPGAANAGKAASGSSPDRLAREILTTTGVKGGLVVHLGCGDGRLTAALRADERYTVHGLDTDPANVEAARAHVASLGLYGPVSVERLAGAALPYTDNLVNLVVAEDCGPVPRDEILRVLAPEGIAYLKAGGAWEKIVKPRPADI
ncbi:MAG: class I SAM-dependent methyltransferase, partial [Chloroflexota bacterium]